MLHDGVLLYDGGDKVSFDNSSDGSACPLLMAEMDYTLIFGDKDHSAYMTDNVLIEKGISQVEFDCTKMGDALLTAIVALRQCIFSQFLHLLLKKQETREQPKSCETKEGPYTT